MVSPPSKWARGSSQYQKRPSRHSDHLAAPPAPQTVQAQVATLGVSYEPFETVAIQPSGLDRARFRFRAHLPELVWNAVALEGNTFTLPEVKTLLDGVTVGGKRLDDAEQIIALSEAYSRLDQMVGDGTFELTKAVSDELHGLVARHEAIESGSFRGERHAQGGGTVRLANGGIVEGTEHGPGGQYLRDHFHRMTEHLAGLDAPERSFVYFAAATRYQFYFDGNKRTARLMMAGDLMSRGFDAVSVPFARKLEFNQSLDTMFSTDDATDLCRFLATCTITP